MHSFGKELKPLTVSTLYNVCAVHWRMFIALGDIMSTPGGVQYTGVCIQIQYMITQKMADQLWFDFYVVFTMSFCALSL